MKNMSRILDPYTRSKSMVKELNRLLGRAYREIFCISLRIAKSPPLPWNSRHREETNE